MVNQTQGWRRGRGGLWVLLVTCGAFVPACGGPGSPGDPDAARSDVGLGEDASVFDFGTGMDASVSDLGRDGSTVDASLEDQGSGDSGAVDSGADAGPPIDCVIAQIMGSRTDAPATLVDLVSIRTCGGTPMTGLTAADLDVRQDDVAVGADAALHLESRPRSVVRVVHFLVDTSNVADRTEAVASLRAALVALQGSANPDRNYVAISLFAGQAGVVSGVPTLDYDTLNAELTALEAYVAPDGGASNLNEALVAHVAASRSSRDAIAVRAAGGAFPVGYTIVVTGRGDSAGRATDQAAIDAIDASGEQVYFASPGVLPAAQRTRLEAIANRGVEDLTSAGGDGVGVVTDQVADELGALYIASLCSTARAGTHSLTFYGALGLPFQEAPSRMFDATGFAGGCGNAFLDLACQSRECGGMLCGACDDRVAACDAQSGACSNFCPDNACRDEQITNPLGYSQVCAERDGARVCYDRAGLCFAAQLDEPCPCVPEVISGVPDPACPSGTTCYPDVLGERYWGGRCVVTGATQVDDPCENITDCAPGLACGVDIHQCRADGSGCERRCRPLVDPRVDACPPGQLVVNLTDATEYVLVDLVEHSVAQELNSRFDWVWAWCDVRGVACESDAHCDVFSDCLGQLCAPEWWSPTPITQCVIDDTATGGYRCPDGSECVEYRNPSLGGLDVVTGRICAPSCACSGTSCCNGVTASGFPTICSAARFDDGRYDAFPVRGVATGGENYCIPAWFPTAVNHPLFGCTATATAGTTCRRVSGPRCPSGLACVTGTEVDGNRCVGGNPTQGEGCVYTDDYFLECADPESQTGVPDPRCLSGTSCYASMTGPPRCYRTGDGISSAVCSVDSDCAPRLVCTAGLCAEPTP